MSIERDKFEFTDKEREGIAEASRNVARVGEDCVWTLIYARNKLMQSLLKSGVAGVVMDDVFYTATQFRHQIDIIT